MASGAQLAEVPGKLADGLGELVQGLVGLRGGHGCRLVGIRAGLVGCDAGLVEVLLALLVLYALLFLGKQGSDEEPGYSGDASKPIRG